MPSLLYEVVWTRQIALLVGSQVEAIAAVLVGFFGGLALGSWAFGTVADRLRQPLRLYAALECGAALLAVATSTLIDPALGVGDLTGLPWPLAPALILPSTVLLGGCLPALLCAADSEPRAAARTAGWLAGANTLGAVAGVAAASFTIPSVGLQASMRAGASLAFATGVLALVLARLPARASPPSVAEPEAPSSAVLFAAALAGATTLACEVLAARGAGLRLGSSLYAWACVLGLFLAGLALGNFLAARRAARSTSPVTDLGVIELLAALAVTASLPVLLPDVASPPAGLTTRTLGLLAIGVLPMAVAMGAAFPLLVRLSLRHGAATGAEFGRLSAANTAGGIGGSILASFVLLPMLGLGSALLACAVMNALVGCAFLIAGAGAPRPAALRVALAAGALIAVAIPASSPRRASDGTLVLHVEHGADASAVVLRVGGERRLFVDGELEAATGGAGRLTEELLAVLALVLHPEPRSVLEVGLGSGITLATAARFPVDRVVCVEIADSVVHSARYFTPDNANLASGTDPRVRVVRGDGRAFLRRERSAYDVVLANTVHPWSLGATGLYSREYFERVARALREGGLAVQWLPVERIGGISFAAILRTFFTVFPEGGVWWAAENVMLVGSHARVSSPDPGEVRERLLGAGLRPEALGLEEGDAFGARWVASAAAVRGALGPGEVLSDDRPSLEAPAGRRRAGAHSDSPLAVVVKLAEAHARSEPRSGPLLLWLESRLSRVAGETERATRLENLAEEAGLSLARRSRLERTLEAGRRALGTDQLAEAARSFRAVLDEDPDQPQARFGLAAVAARRRHWDAARSELTALLSSDPRHAEGWNLLGVVEGHRSDFEAARDAFERASGADPFFPEALANAGLLALATGDVATAQRMLERLRVVTRGAPTREEQALADALTRAAANSARIDLDAAHP